MKRLISALVGVAVLALWAVSASAAGSGDNMAASLHGRHAIALHGGLFNHGDVQSSTGVGGTTTRVNGFAGYLSYGYGVAPEWQVGVTAGFLDAEVLSSVTPGSIVSRTASISPILLEVRWRPLGVAMGATGRPFVGAGVGPYVGTASNSVVGTTLTNETVREVVAGGRALIGIDWILGQRFLMGLSGGYHLVAEFDQQIGSEKDYSGAEALIEFGVLLGKPR